MNRPRFRSFFAAMVVALLLATPVTAGQQLPALGGASLDVVNSLEEKRLGRQFMRSARRQMDFSDDPEVNRYIRDLGNALVSSIGLSPDDFTFSVVNDPNLNAFAVPGGFISVHSGLIAETASESELASVIAHEIAHITQRHLPRMIARAKERSLPAAAAMIAAILVGGQMGSAALVGANAALAADQLQYSRDFEKEADAVGIRILASSGFEPAAMPAFFQKLQKSSMLQASDIPEYLRTHPLSVSRVADSEARVADYPATTADSSDAYRLTRARVRALTSSEPERQAGYFADIAAKGGPDSLAARYGEAIARLQASQYALAATLLDRLLADSPGHLAARLAKGQVALRGGRVEEAASYFAVLYAEDKDDAVRAQYYAEALIAAHDYSSARKVLRRWQRNDPANPHAWRLLSRVDGELGRRAESFQARAEYLALLFESKRALDELDKAREYARGDFYLTSSIDARARELRDELVRFGENDDNR
ncbi:MAG: M48 family peptidase [Proteobacteria bacterium]|nr:MAG: M48 family peptidase [Pseudomonadota bacterium]